MGIPDALGNLWGRLYMDKNEVVRRALRFPIDDVLRRYMADYGVTEEEAHEHELEMKRYLALSALNKGKRYTPVAPVLNLWQTFILFTMLYTEFCTVVAGGYIHHTPPSARSKAAQGYSDLLADYQAVFQTAPPAHVWPVVEGSSEGPLYADSGPVAGSRV
jgi:hypothetical protein